MIEQTFIDITVSPKSSRSKITIDEKNNIKVYLNSPPIDGKANDECVRLFSKLSGIAKSNISIEKGDKGKRKRLLLIGIEKEALIQLIKQNSNR